MPASAPELDCGTAGEAQPFPSWGGRHSPVLEGGWGDGHGVEKKQKPEAPSAEIPIISKLSQDPHKPRNASWTQEVKDHLNSKFPSCL